MSYAIPVDEPGGVAPAALSVLVHLVLFAVLVFGLRWQSKHPDAVVAELWSELPASEPPAPTIEPKPEVRPQLRLESKLERIPAKPDIAIEREKKLAKKKEEPPLRFDTTQIIREQLAQEQQALKRTRERQEALKQFAPAADSSIDAGYADKIRTKIKPNIVLPPDIKGNPEAIFDVVQLPTGVVLSAHLRKSSGHRAYDDAVERAILKSSPLPRPDRPEQFQRNLNLKFRPYE
ncbi:MAG: TonB C-terminal domain-containing protein [Betaproteobacteria bacterium]|nr:MAG: TonB C-terminal domain-containing protein [Betaproteobacteria bacterium]